jgi:hypothetical protein
MGALGSVQSLFALVEKLGLEQVLVLLAQRETACGMVQSGATLRVVSKKLGISLKLAHYATRSVNRRHRKQLQSALVRNIRRDLETDKQSLRSLARKHGVAVETVRNLRKQYAAYSPESAVKHRCAGCGAEITTHKCLRCSLHEHYPHNPIRDAT